MTHLKASEIIDAVEGNASPERTRHLEVCDRCREELRNAAGALETARGVPPPETSPLYWDHLASNIRERIREQPPTRRSLAWVWAPATAIVGAVAIVIGISNMHGTNRTAAPIPGPGPLLDRTLRDPADDSSWSLMSDIADDLAWEDVEAAGLAIRPGAADHAAMDLSADQREELARLLQEEMARLKS